MFRSPFHFGPSKTNVPRKLWTLFARQANALPTELWSHCIYSNTDWAFNEENFSSWLESCPPIDPLLVLFSKKHYDIIILGQSGTKEWRPSDLAAFSMRVDKEKLKENLTVNMRPGKERRWAHAGAGEWEDRGYCSPGDEVDRPDASVVCLFGEYWLAWIRY